MDHVLTIGTVAERTGVRTSTLRYYESEGLITSRRTEGAQRRYTRDVIRRVSFILIAKEVGLRLDEIREALDGLPDGRAPTERDWSRLSASWRPRLDEQIAILERLRDRLDACIGCGCLSLKVCRIANPDDVLGASGPGPRFVLGSGNAGSVGTREITPDPTAGPSR